MRTEIINEKYGKIVLDESAWTGKKNITINDIELTKVGKTSYKYNDGENELFVNSKGNFISGFSLIINSDIIQITGKIKWYEAVLALLPFIFIMVWGNSVTLCSIFPVVGGAIGGAVAGIFGVLSALGMKSNKNIFVKIIIGLGATIVTILICYLLAVAFLSVVA